MRRLADTLYLLDGLPPCAINVYLMGGVIVDSGTRHAARRILRQVRGYPVSALTLTHAHPDHQGSCHAVCSALGLPLCCGAADADAVEDPGLMLRRLSGHWLTRTIGPRLAGPAHPVRGGSARGMRSAASRSSGRRAIPPGISPTGARPTACWSSATSLPISAPRRGWAASASPHPSSRPIRPRIAARPVGSPLWSPRWSASATGHLWTTRRGSSNSSDDCPLNESASIPAIRGSGRAASGIPPAEQRTRLDRTAGSGREQSSDRQDQTQAADYDLLGTEAGPAPSGPGEPRRPKRRAGNPKMSQPSRARGKYMKLISMPPWLWNVPGGLRPDPPPDCKSQSDRTQPKDGTRGCRTEGVHASDAAVGRTDPSRMSVSGRGVAYQGPPRRALSHAPTSPPAARSRRAATRRSC